jgi:hypothetical protein
MATELPDGWKDGLPEDIKSSGVLTDITTIDQMATMVVNGRKLQAKQISIPSEDASPEARDTFLKDLQGKIPDLVYVGEGADLNVLHDRMGRPKEATGYEMGEIPDPLKDNFATLAAKAHELGMSGKQMKGISESILGDYTNNLNLAAGNMETMNQEMKAEFGDAVGFKKETAAAFAKQLGFDENMINSIEAGNMGVTNMKAFDKLMEGFESAGPRIGDEPGAGGFAHLTPDQAELQLSDIMNNKDHPYWDGSSPAHKAAITKVVELTRAADAGIVQTESEKFRDALLGNG